MKERFIFEGRERISAQCFLIFEKCIEGDAQHQSGKDTQRDVLIGQMRQQAFMIKAEYIHHQRSQRRIPLGKLGTTSSNNAVPDDTQLQMTRNKTRYVKHPCHKECQFVFCIFLQTCLLNKHRHTPWHDRRQDD